MNVESCTQDGGVGIGILPITSIRVIEVDTKLSCVSDVPYHFGLYRMFCDRIYLVDIKSDKVSN